MAWDVVLAEEVEEWFLDLASSDPSSAAQVEAAIEFLVAEGPMLGRPLVDRIKGSRLHHLKELRPGSAGRTEIRLLFTFDPQRDCVLLTAGDKAGNWQDWYKINIPLAEERYQRYLEEVDRDGA